MAKKKLSLKKKTGGKTTGDLNKIKASYIEPYKKGGKLPMYLNAGEIEEPTFNIGDEGYNENLMDQGKKLGQIMDIQNPYNFDPSLTYSLQNYTGKNPTLTTEEQIRYDKYKKSLNKNIVNSQGYTNIQGGRSATDTFLTGLSNLPKAIQDPSNPANWAAVGDLPMTGAKAITSAVGAYKTNKRNAKYVTDLTKQAQLEPYQNTYFDDQYGTMKNPVTLAHGGGIPSKFTGERHYNGGTPILTDISSSNANDMKVPRELANLEVEKNEYYVPNAEEGGKTENAFVLSDRKNVGWAGKSPSQHYEDITKAEFGISADKFNKNINKRDKFIADNIKFLGNKEAEQTEDVVSKLTQNIQDGMLDLAHNVYMTQESIKKEKGMKNDLEQAKTGIKIKPSKKGTFKAQATKMGMGVQEAASKILNAPEGKYSAAMRRKANFAKNFAKEVGGEIPDDQVYPGMEMFMEYGGYLPKAKYGVFNYNFQPDKNVIDPSYGKMGKQKTPTGLVYNPPLDYRGWQNLQNKIDLAHNNQVPIIENGNYYGVPNDKQGLINLSYQEQYYDDMLETPQGRQALAKMWQDAGKTLKGKNIKVDTSNLTKLNDKELYDKLNTLRPAYLDSYTKFRKTDYYNPASQTNTPQLKQTPTSDTPSKINMDLTGISKGKTNLPNVIPALRFKEPYLTTPPALFQEEPYLTQYRNPDLEPALVEQRRLYSTLGKNLNPTQKANLAATIAGKTNELYGNYFNQVQQGKQAVDQFNAQTLAGVRGRNIARGDKFYTDWMQTLGNLGTQQLLDTQAANQDWANIQHEGRMADYAKQIYNPDYIDYMQYANPTLQKYPQTSDLDEKTYKVDKSGNLVLVGAKDKQKSGGRVTKRFKKKK